MSLRSRCKHAWARVLLRDVHYRDRHKQLDVLYRVRDPWGLDCDRERSRFAATNAIICREFGRVGSLVEIGCGEGLQSAYLSDICDQLTGIDVSPLAVGRARARCPEASFVAGDITQPGGIDMPKQADLIVACEVLYYVRAVPSFLDCMSKLGKACLVTYYAPHRERLAPEIASGRNVRSELIRHGETEWVVSWWTNTRPTDSDAIAKVADCSG